MSKLETNTIDTVSGTSTLQVGSTNTSTITLGVSGDTINVPSGVTIANSGTATGFGESNLPYLDVAVSSATYDISDNVYTTIAFNTVNHDTCSGWNSSSYRYVPNVAGKYLCNLQVNVWGGGNNRLENMASAIRKNGSNESFSTSNATPATDLTEQSLFNTVILTMNGSSDYIEGIIKANVTTGSPRVNGENVYTMMNIMLVSTT